MCNNGKLKFCTHAAVSAQSHQRGAQVNKSTTGKKKKTDNNNVNTTRRRRRRTTTKAMATHHHRGGGGGSDCTGRGRGERVVVVVGCADFDVNVFVWVGFPLLLFFLLVVAFSLSCTLQVLLVSLCARPTNSQPWNVPGRRLM